MDGCGGRPNPNPNSNASNLQMVAPKYGFKGPWDAMNRRSKRHGITCELPNNCVMECLARAKDLTVTVPAHTHHGNGHVEEHFLYTIDKKT